MQGNNGYRGDGDYRENRNERPRYDRYNGQDSPLIGIGRYVLKSRKNNEWW